MLSKHLSRCHFCVKGVSKDALVEIIHNAVISLPYSTVLWNSSKQSFCVYIFHNLLYTRFKIGVLPGEHDLMWWLNFKLFTCRAGMISRELGLYAYHMVAAWPPLATPADLSLTHPEYHPHSVFERHVLPCGRTRTDVLQVFAKNGMLSLTLSDAEVRTVTQDMYLPVNVAVDGLIDSDRFELCIPLRDEHGDVYMVPRYHATGDLNASAILSTIYPMLVNQTRIHGLTELARIMRRPSNLTACRDAEVLAMLHGLMDQFDSYEPPYVLEAYLVFVCVQQLHDMNAHSLFPQLDACLERARHVFDVARSRVCSACASQNQVYNVHDGTLPSAPVRLYARCVVCHVVA